MHLATLDSGTGALCEVCFSASVSLSTVEVEVQLAEG